MLTMNSDIGQDLSFYNGLRKERGMLKTLRADNGSSSSEGNKKKIKELCTELDIIDLEERMTELDDAVILSCLEISYDSEYNTLRKNVEGRRKKGKRGRFKINSKRAKAKVAENFGGFSKKAKTLTSKTAKKFSKTGDERAKGKVRVVSGLNTERKSVVDENGVKEEVDYDSLLCKSPGEHSKEMDFADENFVYFLKSRANYDETNQGDESSDVEILDMEKILFREDYAPFESTEKYCKKMDRIGASYESLGKCGEKMVSSSKSSNVKILYKENIPSLEEFVPCKSTGEHSKKMDHVDESYDYILKSWAKCGEGMLLSCETDHKDEIEILDMENISFHEGGYTPVTPPKCYQSLLLAKKKPGEKKWEAMKDCNQSWFREKLTDLLKMPYDQKELKSLWRKLIYKKPVQGWVNLRRGGKQYSTNIDGKSYLDWYEDLRKKIDEFRPDEHKILYLLRGFFFWLKNTPHEGAFKPWLDSSYLNALELTHIHS